MEKPFDIKVLVQKLEAKGLPMAEQLAEAAADSVLEWTEESIAIHPSAMVKALGLPAVQILKPLIKQQIDKIDGQPG